ncbi:hypothetical protein HQN87_27505 [Paenibacillus tritici]|uniref:PKD domain-containing protein n=1 Tax=Paenibacillus tritici TaxID=1873425 RepID=A0ABX2DWH9_9BACL|nr:hypothetical protein [Paenibacillus tritici]NQX49077.1 hypothetical protein [Paenibacillus tritici]
MKKVILLCLCVSLIVPFVFSKSVQAADTKSTSISIPITTGLLGSDNSAKNFYLELPNGVTSSSIKTGSLKYNGPNGKVSVSLENGKIKVALNGVANQKYYRNVVGYKASWDAMFRTQIYNSIWLYSDGRRWQINEYDEHNDRMKTGDVTATDVYPSRNPPRTKVTAGPYQDNLFLKWYNGSVNEVVNNQDIIQSTIKVVSFEKSSYAEDPKFKNGRVILNYTIPDGVPWDAESNDGLSGKAEGRKYKAFASYYYTADAKVTTYSYGGLVTFDYSPPDQATLNGTATLEKPSPNPIKLEGSKVDVKINVKGELLGYTDSSNIEEWVFYANEKNGTGKADMKKDYSKQLTASKSFDLSIPASRVINDNFKQDYILTVVIRFKKPVLTKSGTITSLEQKMEVSAGVYKTDNPITYPSVPSKPTKPEGKPPIARISAPKYIKAGSDMMVYGGNSSDPDGYITDYAWGTPGAQGGIENTARGYVWYTRDDVGQTFPITLTVVDNDGLIGSTSTEVTVIEPVPSASLEIIGSLKQNRKTTLINSSQSPTRFPIIKSKTQVTISAVSGGTNADIKYSGNLAELESKDILFKKPGKYKATIHVENTAGYASDKEIIFDIAPDESPFAYFAMPIGSYRDPGNGNKAIISIDDMSFSSDKDNIIQRIWEYRYDSNNNGNFTDEGWVQFSDANQTRLNLELYQVGKYEVRVTVLEEFGQPTIEDFVTDADRLRTNSEATQNVIERIVEVNNRAPEVDWDL